MQATATAKARVSTRMAGDETGSRAVAAQSMSALRSGSRAAAGAMIALAVHVAAVATGVEVLQESAGGNRAGFIRGSSGSPGHLSGTGSSSSGSGRGMTGLPAEELYSRVAAGSVAVTASAEDVNSSLQQLRVMPAVGVMLTGVVAAGAGADHVMCSAGGVSAAAPAAAGVSAPAPAGAVVAAAVGAAAEVVVVAAAAAGVAVVTSAGFHCAVVAATAVAADDDTLVAACEWLRA
jgi:hypothetical protein